MKQISKEEIQKLIDNKYLRNSSEGYVDKMGNTICFYRTRNKKYIEDKYADIAKKLT